jgi:predicted kinase
MPTLYLTCGLPGSGKTTLAKRIERSHNALRLTADEWLFALFGPEPEPPEVIAVKGATALRRNAVEALQWEVAARALALGVDVVIDWGLWSREERDDYRARAAALGARVVVCFVDAPLEELARRLAARNASAPPGVLYVDPQYLALWSTWFERPTGDELHERFEIDEEMS